MRTCTCRRCGEQLVVGHPEALLRRRARQLAREAAGLLRRVTGRAAREIESRLVEEFYADKPDRHRRLPSRCPACHFAGDRDLPWWEPGISIRT